MLLYSARVIAFEPRQEAANSLRVTFGGTRLATVEEVALSNETGTAQIRIPARLPMLSTIERRNRLDGADGVVVNTVQTKRLDDYEISPVGFIKIDVEGHEQAVLDGARTSLGAERPTVPIEAQERHNAGTVRAVAGFFQPLGYAGYFFLEGKLRPIAEFAAEAHQDCSHLQDGRRLGIYINNFLFVPKTNLQRIPGHYLAR